MKRAYRLGPPVCLALVVGSATMAPAEEPCLPLTRSSLARVAEIHGLDGDQVRWLLDAYGAGRLAEPVDLEGWPGVGPEQRDAVAADLCWDRIREGQATLGNLSRDHSEERRATMFLQTQRLELAGRVRTRSAESARLVRGGAVFRWGRWRLAAGTLEGRRGLGLALETAGTESRSTAPRAFSSRPFGTALGSDSGTLSGAALGTGAGPWSADVAVLGGSGSQGHPTQAIGVLERRGRQVRIVGLGMLAAGGPVASLAASGSVGPAGWAAEAARNRNGAALGLAGSGAPGNWRLRAHLLWRGKGFSSPLARGWERSRRDAVVSLVSEARWVPGRGRTLRLARIEETTPTKEGFPRITTTTEVEASERLARGVELTARWRGRGRTENGIPLPSDSFQELRGEIRAVRNGLEARLRLDQRLDGSDTGALHTTLSRTRKQWSWQLRAVRIHAGPEADAVRVYFRRAGDLVGWTTAGVGTTLGFWGRHRRGNWAVEGSGDRGAGVWTWTVALRMGFGGAS